MYPRVHDFFNHGVVAHALIDSIDPSHWSQSVMEWIVSRANFLLALIRNMAPGTLS
jgi:hypothetical protein